MRVVDDDGGEWEWGVRVLNYLNCLFLLSLYMGRGDWVREYDGG
jgi:hypothetical protein